MYTIKEFGNGKFQVWKDNEWQDDQVLDPEKLTWHPSYQACHAFMFVDSLQEAEERLYKVRDKYKIVRERHYGR